MKRDRTRVEHSMILMPNDQEEPIYLRKRSFPLLSLGSNSPSSYQELHSKRDSTIEEDLARLSEDLQTEKDRNESLSFENSQLLNENYASNALTNELEAEKRKLVREIHQMSLKCESLQTEKIISIEEIGQLKSQLACLHAKLLIKEEQFFHLDSQCRNLQQKLNLEKEISAELQRQNQFLRAQLQSIVKNYHIAVTEVQKRIPHTEFVDQVNLKAKELEGQIKFLRVQIQGIEATGAQINKTKEQMFNYVTCLELKHKDLIQELFQAKWTSGANITTEMEQLKYRCSQLEHSCREMVSSRDHQIEDLRADNALLRKQNQELQDEIQSQCSSLPKLHTNTQYVNKLIKENIREARHSRELMDSKDQQLQILKERLLEEETIRRNQAHEISRLEAHIKHDNQMREVCFQAKMNELAQENKQLVRKVDELSAKQSQLRVEIAEKDKIILNCLHRNKSPQ